MKSKTDKYLKEILKDVKLDSPSEDFTSNIMKRIQLEDKPVIQQKTSFFKKYKFMIIFSLTFIVIFLLVFFFTDGQSAVMSENISIDPNDSTFLNKLRDIFSVNLNISVTQIIIIIASFLLLSLDVVIPKINKKFIESTDY